MQFKGSERPELTLLVQSDFYNIFSYRVTYYLLQSPCLSQDGHDMWMNWDMWRLSYGAFSACVWIQATLIAKQSTCI